MKHYGRENKERLLRLLAQFPSRKICVIGDVMLDHYLYGDVDRISPEAPTPIVLVHQESSVPGGAANVAKNIVAADGAVFLVGVVGKDASGATLRKMLHLAGVDIRAIYAVPDRPTTQKVRIVARGHQMVRVDKESVHAISRKAQERIARFVSANIHRLDAIVFSDYAKGCLSEPLTRDIIALARKAGKPVIGDVKPQNASCFSGATLLTPNHKEASAIALRDGVSQAGRYIQKKLRCDVLITQGASGMTLFDGARQVHFPAHTHEVYDVTGAGDTVTAIAALALASGASLSDAAYLANCAAGIVVAKQGTAVASAKELAAYLKNA